MAESLSAGLDVEVTGFSTFSCRCVVSRWPNCVLPASFLPPLSPSEDRRFFIFFGFLDVHVAVMVSLTAFP